jgi:WD40 repeat protein
MNFKDPENVPPVWRVGDVILDRYEVKQVFTGGGMGLVYRVHHRDWDMDLAAKAPRPKFFQSQRQIENFEREAETWVNLGLHPHIVSCYYVRRLGGIPHIFAEFVEGGTLADWIRTKKLYDGGKGKALERILDVAIQCAWGLHYAHEKGFVHQDVKPGNVFLSPDGTAKVGDFGLANARRVSGEGATVAARAGQSILVSGCGLMTPEYASPEQLRGERLSRKTDIWSWAVSLLEMLLGELTWSSGIAAPAVVLEELVDGRLDGEIVALLDSCFGSRSHPRLTSFDAVIQSLTSYYASRFGAYYRAAPRPAELLADALNNRAASLVDLNQTDEAIRVLNKAIELDPRHTEATYNRGVLLWRSARGTDHDLLARIDDIRYSKPNDWKVAYLSGLVHLERCDFLEAVRSLREATRLGGSNGVLIALKEALSLTPNRAGYVRTFEGHTASVNSVCLSSDNRWALSGSSDETLRLWEVATGRCLRTFEGHAATVESACLSSDNRWALSGSSDETLGLWEVATGRCLRTFEGHAADVYSVCLSSDNRWALSGSLDNTLRLWELATGRCVRVLEGHASDVYSVCLSSDNRWALSGSHDETLRLWEVGTGRCLRTFEGHTGSVDSVCLSSDNQRALAGSNDKTLRLWEVGTGRCLRTFEGHTGSVDSVCLSSDNRWVLSGSFDNTLRLCQMGALNRNGSQRMFSLVLCRAIIAQAAVEADQRFAESTRKAKAALSTEHWDEALEHARSARAIPGYEADHTAMDVWNRAGLHCFRAMFRAGRNSHIFEENMGIVFSVCLSSDTRWLLSANFMPVSRTTTLRLLDLASGRCLRIFYGNMGIAFSACLSSDNRWVLSGHSDNMLRLWDAATGQCLRNFTGHVDSVNSVCFIPGECFALSGSSDNTLRLWEVDTGRCLRVFKGHAGRVHSICISSDNRSVLSGSADNTLRLWDMAAGQCLKSFVEQTKGVRSVCLSADRRLALSGHGDKALRLWEISAGRCVRTLEGTRRAWSLFALAWMLGGRSREALTRPCDFGT